MKNGFHKMIAQTILVVGLICFYSANVQAQEGNTPSSGENNLKDRKTVSWETVNDAKLYQVEWTYHNNYGDEEMANSEEGLFKKGATRIETVGTTYDIPLIYENGYLYVRVRAYKNDKTYSKWEYFNGVNVKSNDNDMMNWQAVVDYAEEGKNKEVMTYYDGTSRARQSVTRNSSNNDIIVGETYYDHQGRPAVQALPVPTLKSSDVIEYHDLFNVYKSNESKKPYDRKAFDVSASDNNCGVTVSPMSDMSGSSKYYSAENKSTDFYTAYIPNADGYPFSQTEYTPDNTGRIRRQGGVGPQYQLSGNDSHPTSYYYGKPTQEDLWRLFGSQSGDFSHYQKNMVKDPNGSIQVSYVDMHGRTVATALAGTYVKDNLTFVKLDGSPDATQRTVSILDYPTIPVGETKYFSQFVFLSTEEGDKEFNYQIKLNPVMIGNVCLSCKYRLVIGIQNDCGIVVSKDTTFPGDQLAGLENTISINFKKELGVGNYTITRTLEIDPQTRVEQVEKYLESEEVKSLYDFIEEELAHTDFTNCKPNDCISSCLEQNFQTYDEYVDCVSQCESGNDSECDDLRERMKEDMVPGVLLKTQFESETANTSEDKTVVLNPVSQNQVLGGQYAVFSYDDNGNVVVETNSPSILQDNIFNALVKDEEFLKLVRAEQVSVDDIKTKEGFVKNFKSSWTAYLAEKYHPEWNRVVDCDLDRAMKFYDYKMNMVDSYKEALSLGMFDPLGCVKLVPRLSIRNISKYDVFMLRNAYFDNLKSKICQYVNVGEGKNISIWELAVIMTLQDNDLAENVIKNNTVIEFPENNPYQDSYCSTMQIGNQTVSVDMDQVWLNFRTLYLAARNEVYKKVNEQNMAGINEALITKNEFDSEKSPVIARVPNLYAQSESELQNLGTQEGISEAREGAEEKIWLSCVNQANAQVSTVMEDLKDCFKDLSDESTKNAIKDDFAQILAFSAYVSGGILGYSSVPEEKLSEKYPDYVIKPSSSSFEAVLTKYGINLSADCNVDLVTSIPEYGNDNLYSTEKPLDECGCDFIMDMADQYEEKSQSLPYNIRSASAYFTEKTGLTIMDFSKKLCKCRSVKGNNQSWPANSHQTLATSGLTIPKEIVCDVCVPCDEVATALTNFFEKIQISINSIPSFLNSVSAFRNGLENLMTNRLQNALAHNLNQRFNINKTFDEYFQFAQQCQQHSNHNQISSCEPTIAAKQLRVTFNKVLTYNKLKGTIKDSRCYNEINQLIAVNKNSVFSKSSDASIVNKLNELPLEYDGGSSNNCVSSDPQCTKECSSIIFEPFSNDNSQTKVTVRGQGGNDQHFTLFNKDSLLVENIVHVEDVIVDSLGNVKLIVTVVKDNKIVVDTFIVSGNSCDWDFANCKVISSNDELTLCKKDPMTVTVESENECEEAKKRIAVQNATALYDEYIENERTRVNDLYISKCFEITESESLKMNYGEREFHYTLFYYDQAGNLVRTVPPAGVEFVDLSENTLKMLKEDLKNGTQRVFTKHRLETRYVYNSLNQLIYQYMPDHDGFNDITSNGYPFETSSVLGTSYVNSKGVTLVDDPKNTDQSLLYSTDDNGESWTPVSFSIKSNLHDAKAFRSGDAYVCGDDGAIIFKTASNSNWSPIHTDNHDNLISIMGNNEHPYFIAQNGSIFSYNITTQDINRVSNPFVVGVSLSDVSYNASSSLAVGSIGNEGVVFSSSVNSDGTALSWKPVIGCLDPATNVNLNSMNVKTGRITSIAMDGSTGYANDENGLLLQTTDAGKSWTLASGKKMERFKDMCMDEKGGLFALSDNGELRDLLNDRLISSDVKLISGSDNLYYIDKNNLLKCGNEKLYDFSNEVISDFAVLSLSTALVRTYVLYYVTDGKLYKVKITRQYYDPYYNVGENITQISGNYSGVVVRGGAVYVNSQGIVGKVGEPSSNNVSVSDNVWDVSENGNFVVAHASMLSAISQNKYLAPNFILPRINAVSVSGTKAVAVGDNGLVLVCDDLASQKFTLIPSHTSKNLLSVSYYQNKAYIGGLDGLLLSYNGKSVSERQVVPSSEGDITALTYRPSTNCLFIGNSLGRVRRLDLSNNVDSGWEQLDANVNYIDAMLNGKLRIIGGNAMVIDAE